MSSGHRGGYDQNYRNTTGRNDITGAKVAHSVLGLEKEVDIEFKWNDNMQENGNIMDFYVNGDTALGGRFNFIYSPE